MTRIKAVALDVDGVLTDGSLYWGPDGEELRRISHLDVTGIALAKKQGFVIAFVSGEDCPLIDRLAAKLGVQYVYRECPDKAAALADFAAANGLHTAEVCYMGDDVDDISAMALSGLAAAPVNAMGAVREMAHFISNKRGGDGAVRELLEHLMSARSLALEAQTLWAS